MNHLAIVPGDGIGKEVVDAGITVLEAVSQISSFDFDGEMMDIGAERYLSTGELLTEQDLSDLRSKDAVYFGAVGDPRVRPGVLEKNILLKMRTALDQYINLRPVRSWHPLGPLKSDADFDIHFIRENTEDFYLGAGGRFGGGHGSRGDINIMRKLYSLDMTVTAASEPDMEFAYEVGVISRAGAERFADYAFSHAAERGEDKVTLVDKANVCTDIYGLLREVFEEKASEHGMSLQYMFVDAMAMALVARPGSFGTVAMPNMFGDILTDLGAEIQGGLGMGASGNICPDGVSMFEPIHGSAPDIAGRGMANPFGAILAAGMMLDHLGYGAERDMIVSAVEGCIASGKTTADLGGALRTSEVAAEVCKRISEE
jgi:3-isopropylmalate dehydrogenase